MTVAPLSKTAGIVGLILAVGAACAAAGNALPPKYAAIVIAFGAGLSTFAHSITGNGTYIPPKP